MYIENMLKGKEGILRCKKEVMGKEVWTGSLILSTYPKCNALLLTMKQSGP